MVRPVSERERQLGGKRVFLTGAGGFIGSHLCQRLLAAGCKVKALVRYNSKNNFGFLEGVEHPHLEVVAGDVCDAEFIRRSLGDSQMVFHLAALIAIPYSYTAPGSYVDVNITGTLNLLQVCRERGIERFLQTSTSEVYGSAQRVPMDESHPLHPQSPYAATKVAADQLAASFYHSFETPVTIVRPFNTYGPRQSLRAVVPTICVQALRGEQLQLGNLSALRDLTYVEDTCAGFLHAATAEGAVGETVNLGFGECYAVSEIVERVGRLLGKQLDVKIDQQRLRPPGSEVDRLLSDNSKAARLLDWKPEVDLDRGLKELLDYARQQPSGPSATYVL